MGNPYSAAFPYSGQVGTSCYWTGGVCDRNQGYESPGTTSFAAFGLSITNPYGNAPLYTTSNRAVATSEIITVFLNDRHPPVIGAAPPASDVWTDDDGKTYSLPVTFTDKGLGLKSVNLTGVASGGYPIVSGCTGDIYRGPCRTDLPVTYSYTLNEGINQPTLHAADIVGNSSTRPWTQKIDRTPPQIQGGHPTGALWDARNRDDDHRFEGLYDDSYGLNVVATDGGSSNANSGVKNVEVVIGPSGGALTSQRDAGGYAESNCNASGCPNRLELNWDLNPDRFPDGDYTVKIVTRDQVAGSPGAPDGRHVTTQTFDVTIDRRGDIFHATEFDVTDTPRDQTATEWARLLDRAARREEPGSTRTRRLVPCPESATQRCVEERDRFRTDPDDSEAYRAFRGASETDPRIDLVAEILEPVTYESQQASDTGPIAQAVEPWQTLPPSHGPTYVRYDTTDASTDTEGTQSDEVTRTWADQATGLMLRRQVTAGSSILSDERYDYARARTASASAADDLFAVEPPSGVSGEASPVASVPRTTGDPEPPSRSDLISDGQEFRQEFGLPAGEELVSQIVDDVSVPLSRYGLKLTNTEVQTIDRLFNIAADKKPLQQYIQNHPDAQAAYAGMYSEVDGTVHAAFTGDAGRFLEPLRQVSSYPGALVTDSVDTSLAELEALQGRIVGDLDALAIDGIDVSSVGIDFGRNQVRVRASDPQPDTVTKLRDRYGTDALFVERGSHYTTAVGHSRLNFYGNHHGRWHGGLGINPVYKEGSHADFCSLGFSLKKTHGPRAPFFRLLTAGHCAAIGDKYVHGNDDARVGTVTGQFFDGDTDAETIRAHRRTVSAKVVNRVYADKPWQAQAIEDFSDAGQGDPACMVGRKRYGPYCGHVTDGSAEVEYGDHKVRDVVEASLRPWPRPDGKETTYSGNSGGAVYARRYALGILSGTALANDEKHPSDNDPAFAYWTPMTRIMFSSKFDMELYVGTRCGPPSAGHCG